MRHLLLYIAIVVLAAGTFTACSPTNHFTARYYKENQAMLHRIRDTFQVLYKQKPFSLEFKDKNFRFISFELLSDTMRYIYNFDLDQPNFADTLYKYGYNAKGIIGMAADMREIKCTWIAKLSYFENRLEKQLVFISVRHNKLKSFMKGEKYYALAFFNERQYFDKQGRLTDKSEKRRMREINGQIFHRITDRICYAITGNFR